MFRGANSLSLDDKGRFSIPTRYRQPLLSEEQGAVICTIAINEPCLWLYPLSEWREIESRLQRLSNTNPRVRRWQRMLLGHAEEYQLDKNGRILLAPTLRAHAGLGKKLMLVGLLNKFEIWDEARWYEQMQADTEIERSGDVEACPELDDFSL
ncbi:MULTISPECIES: division/cell wall cluster transcriptional repressor MraZ [Pseudoalteromonas]|uniref:Transcriptional regulator MraZ n=1 Tax=Pseudoalteromonas rubra TaxID=43658 RepID=A0A0L0EW14_9GAMM|nr:MULTISPECIES: division/cell wall cluster transcriptional repressor MraZ [Pseudoalteromonas]ALU43267.1 division/cell wall cluster transcriptional repressor MraZ [Pseudoalteromonas rubra]KAF7788338.1 MraZ protein [Pseudoalteromonas rubra]KNC68595.1 cell division protein MraZ [Pseudoalteromonas rubra]MCG7536396.1 division/cell wall cluster transcriptional repressor MraZ [Pseudoalteromonas sp. OOF1S-7]MCG7562555.1 division/cell wall cluster transcriptional repressor MraZ [Pseudoalteromonas sp. 